MIIKVKNGIKLKQRIGSLVTHVYYPDGREAKSVGVVLNDENIDRILLYAAQPLDMMRKKM